MNPIFLAQDPQIQVKTTIRWNEESLSISERKSYIIGVLETKTDMTEIEKRGGEIKHIVNAIYILKQAKVTRKSYLLMWTICALYSQC